MKRDATLIRLSFRNLSFRKPGRIPQRERFWQDRGEMADSREGGTRGGRAEGAATLDTVVETVRRILRADTASIASFSESERTMTWLATSGFRKGAAGVGVVLPVRGEFAERAAAFAFDRGEDEMIF